MFRLSKYIKKEIKKKKLSEAYKNLQSVSPEVREYIKDKHSESSVKLINYDPSFVFKEFQKSQNSELDFSDNVLRYAVLRYGFDNILFFYLDNRTLKSKQLLDMYSIHRYMDYQPLNTDTELGFKKYCNKFVKAICGIKEQSQEEVLKKMNFQLIYFNYDVDRIKSDERFERYKQANS